MAEPDDPASPPCALGGADPLYAGLPPEPGAEAAWRRAVRARLIAERRALDPDLRREGDRRIATTLDALVGDIADLVVSLYWPFRAEPDLRAWGAQLIERGARLALPVVEAHGRPLAFRAWAPGDRLVPGIWNIPVPAEDRRLTPEIVIAPVVGFDRQAYRLGYGGGFFDRTLAALPGRWRAIGVGYASARLPSIHPLPHDVPMHAIVTPAGVAAERGDG